MEKETLKRIFKFLEAKEGHNAPFRWKILNNEPITKEDLNVGGDLNLERIEITSLPEGLNVDGNLYLYQSNITSIPKGLKVRGLFLGDSKIKSLPEDLEVKGLDLSGTEITKLPKGLKVDCNLVLKQSKIESLPEGLIVGNDLNLRNCKNLKSLPKGLKVGGDLYIYGTPLNEIEDNDEIREMIKPGFIKGNIY